MTYEPGWRWSVDVKPIAGTPSCQYHHLGVTLSGVVRVQLSDGTELEVGPGDVFEIPPGHDAWVVGDEPWVSVDFEAMRTFAKQRDTTDELILSSIVFTDIVDSTRRAAEAVGDDWRHLVAEHNRKASGAIDRHRGCLVKTTGDGVLAQFDGAERAVRGAAAIRAAARELGITIRVGVHAGELEVTGDDVRGITVHIAARIMAAAGPDEILVGRLSDWPPRVDDPADQELSTEHVETGPMLGHESLPTVWSFDTPNRARRLSAVKNVCGKYT